MKAVTVFLVAVVFECFGAGQDLCVGQIDSGDASYEIFDNFKALEHYGKAYKECPGIFDALMKMTRALVDVGEDFNDKETITFYREALSFTDTMQLHYKDSAQSYFLKSIAAANLFDFLHGKQKLALALVVRSNADKSIELSPSFAPAYIVLGAYYRLVATAGPVQKLLARILYGTVPAGTLQDSKRTLREALRLSPQNIYGRLELAQTLLALGEKQEARDLLESIEHLPVAWHLDKRLKQKAAQLLKNQ
jgi:tetratricopeptide (TPR) repeat protein